LQQLVSSEKATFVVRYSEARCVDPMLQIVRQAPVRPTGANPRQQNRWIVPFVAAHSFESYGATPRTPLKGRKYVTLFYFHVSSRVWSTVNDHLVFPEQDLSDTIVALGAPDPLVRFHSSAGAPG
jgi:hypothetical protein